MKDQTATEKKERKWRWPWQKEVVEIPLYDDVNCPFTVKPSELFAMNEVRTCTWSAVGLHASHSGRVAYPGYCTLLVTLQGKDMDKLKQLGGVTGLCSALGSDHHRGLDPAAKDSQSIDEHRRVYGANTLPSVPQKNFFLLCAENVQDPIILLLIAAALVSSV